MIIATHSCISHRWESSIAAVSTGHCNQSPLYIHRESVTINLQGVHRDCVMINLQGVYFVRSEWLTKAQGSCMLWALNTLTPLVASGPSCTLICGGGDEVDPGQRDCLAIVGEDGASILFVAAGYH